MTLEQTDEFVDIDRPDGERIRVKLRGEAARPVIANGLTRLLLDSADGNFYDAVTAYADGFGLVANYYLGSERVIIEIDEPLTLRPLVNASGGSPRSSASRHSSSPVASPLARFLRLRAPSG
jgi:hypothetical protein